MTECTTCPDATVDSVPAGPIKCGCCGHPIELTCKGKCDPSHYATAIKAAAPLNSAQRTRPGRAHETSPRTYRPKPCVGCVNTFTPVGPRDTFCEACKAKRSVP
jgi:hypothetical protein